MDTCIMSKVESIFAKMICAVLLLSEIYICQVTQYTLTHHFVRRRLIGFVVCCDTVNQQNHGRQREQGHHGDFM